ncbi:MAG TPA: efflux RND transporter periplasmic adaptor subunit [Polyangiaceae bacterium]|jgi:multidrug efflux system membrane fusion protein|nr:efflux RND transporter periplasmic adaptor subunit [Polyangiaceae bacterium]
MTSEVVPGRVEQPKSTRWILAGTLVLALGGAIIFARTRKATLGGTGAPPGDSAALARPVPVVVARASKRDVPVYLDGLGNAVPLVTVTVRPQVDGPLTSILFQEGQQVKKGDLLARIDPRPFAIQLHQAQAALARDQAQAKNAKVNLTRYTALHEQGLATQEQLDDQRATADQLAGTIKSDEAQIENAQLQLNYTEVRSPVDGVTGVRQVDQGNVVHASDANGIVVVTQLDPMAIVFTLPQDNLPQINREIAGGLQIEAYSRDGDRLLGRGKLNLVDNQVSLTTATIRLKGTVPNPDKALWPNEFVRARLLLATRAGALSVPAPAVQRGPQGTFVYIVLADQTAALRPVEVETVQDQWAVIAKGVQDGDQVVVEGQNQLKPGAKVSLRASVTGQANAIGAPGSGNDARPAGEQPAGAGKGKHGGAKP